MSQLLLPSNLPEVRTLEYLKLTCSGVPQISFTYQVVSLKDHRTLPTRLSRLIRRRGVGRQLLNQAVTEATSDAEREK